MDKSIVSPFLTHGVYPQSFFVLQVVSKVVPVSWWKSPKRFSKTSKIQNLADVMIHLLLFRASSASVERVGLKIEIHEIHQNLRNPVS